MKIHIASLLILFAPMVAAEVTEKEIESNAEGIAVKHIYRNEVKVLEVASPTKSAPPGYVNTTYTIIVDSLPFYKYQTSKSGRSFQRLNFVTMDHAVKLHASSGNTVKEILVYSADSKKTIEAFHLRKGQLIPFSDQELAAHRLARSES